MHAYLGEVVAKVRDLGIRFRGYMSFGNGLLPLVPSISELLTVYEHWSRDQWVAIRNRLCTVY